MQFETRQNVNAIEMREKRSLVENLKLFFSRYIYLFIRFYNNCRRLPDTNRHSSLIFIVLPCIFIHLLFLPTYALLFVSKILHKQPLI